MFFSPVTRVPTGNKNHGIAAIWNARGLYPVILYYKFFQKFSSCGRCLYRTQEARQSNHFEQTRLKVS